MVEVTLTLPDAPAPTTAVIVVAFTTVNDDAAVPPKLTAVVPAKFVPVIVTVVPVAAVVGVKEMMVGARFIPIVSVNFFLQQRRHGKSSTIIVFFILNGFYNRQV